MMNRGGYGYVANHGQEDFYGAGRYGRLSVEASNTDDG